MQLLVRVFKAGKNVTQMSEDELKSTLVDVTKEVTYDSVKDESKKAFKNRKNDKKATAIEEDDTIQVLKPDCTYWLHTGIDFGSTNSVMAWRLYKWSDEDDSWLLDEDYNKENNIIRCPTMLIYKKDNLLHPVVQAEPEDVIIGKRAEELADDRLALLAAGGWQLVQPEAELLGPEQGFTDAGRHGMEPPSRAHLFVIVHRSSGLSNSIRPGTMRSRGVSDGFMIRSLLRNDSLVRANACAGAAVDALVGIDDIDVAGRDGLYRAFADAGPACYAGISNLVSHFFSCLWLMCVVQI